MKTKKGIALVMANADYVQQNKLPACKKDGEDIKEVLEYLNFDVISGLDLDRTDMYEIISNFIDEAKSYSTVLVYYSGHGVQIDGDNYFVPIDCEYKNSKAIFKDTQLVGINSITEFMTANPSKTNIMILDACRSTVDFAKDIVGTGLTEIMAGNGTLIAFATSPNEVARVDSTEDGNSYYTKCLLPNIIRPNIKIEDMFKAVRNDVVQMTNGEQVPWENTSLNKDFYFNTMDQDEINEQIYQCIRNNYTAETLILLNRILGQSISELMRIHCRQKSEKPGGIYFEKTQDMEHFLLEQVLELGFEFKNYRWCFGEIPVQMGEFLHNPSVEIRR
ncbi:MAG: caspase family protein [Clostridia bacterium]|nr:caspase family protein [Clostridia bacterium]